MPSPAEKSSKFLNSREWRTFLSSAQAATSYPSFKTAVRAGRAWLDKQTGWLSSEASLAVGSQETLRI